MMPEGSALLSAYTLRKRNRTDPPHVAALYSGRVMFEWPTRVIDSDEDAAFWCRWGAWGIVR